MTKQEKFLLIALAAGTQLFWFSMYGRVFKRYQALVEHSRAAAMLSTHLINVIEERGLEMHFYNDPVLDQLHTNLEFLNIMHAKENRNAR